MSRLCKVEAGQVDKGTFIINGLAALGSLPGNRAAHVNTDSVRMLFEQMMVYQAITEDKMFVQTLDVTQLKRLLPVAQAMNDEAGRIQALIIGLRRAASKLQVALDL